MMMKREKKSKGENTYPLFFKCYIHKDKEKCIKIDKYTKQYIDINPIILTKGYKTTTKQPVD